MSDHPPGSAPTKRERQRQRVEERRVVEQRDTRSAQVRSVLWTIVVLALVAAAGSALWVLRPERDAPTADEIGAAEAPEGVETYNVTDQSHVEGPVEYDQSPPVGGPHASAWQNCGAYDAPVANENGVHSLEHGAVWITYPPDASDADVEALRSLATNPYVLLSSHPDVTTGVVASAWTKQLTLDSVDVQQLGSFVTTFAQGPQTPEPGAPCTGGIGEPVG